MKKDASASFFCLRRAAPAATLEKRLYFFALQRYRPAVLV
jgi:hypothetical protein